MLYLHCVSLSFWLTREMDDIVLYPGHGPASLWVGSSEGMDWRQTRSNLYLSSSHAFKENSHTQGFYTVVVMLIVYFHGFCRVGVYALLCVFVCVCVCVCVCVRVCVCVLITR